MTGKEYGSLQEPVKLRRYRLTSVYDILGRSNTSLTSILDLCQWNELATCFGEEPELVNLEEHGTKPVWRLTLKIREQSGGADTKVSQLLSLMNFVATSISTTSCDGSIVIQSSWRRKEDDVYLKQRGFT